MTQYNTKKSQHYSLQNQTLCMTWRWGGDAIWCNAPARNLQNIKDIYANQPAKTRETPYRIHLLPLLNRHGSKQLIYKNVVCMSSMFCAML